jgi:hypothetical protein
MIVVIQCAASKRSDAGRLVTTSGKPVEFVAEPEAAPTDSSRVYSRPDDLSDSGVPWRKVLLKYNEASEGNPLRLYLAYQLYENKVYGRLVDRLGMQNVYILSAGWGLIRADFLTPHYDITFSQNAEGYKRRRKADRYDDLCMLPDHTDEAILFFGGKDYLPLFCTLTDTIRSTKVGFYNSIRTPQFNGFSFRRFETTTRTNWHYECANAFLDGLINI